MEFKFRAVDQQASTYVPQSSSFSYFNDQALRGFVRNPSDLREVIQRELEKERIREEIIAAEIARRRLLEAEVRREMELERELALRRTDRFSIFSGPYSRLAMPAWFDSRLSHVYQSEGRSPEERFTSRHGLGGFETLPFHPHAEHKAKISEVKHTVEISNAKEKVNFLAKPEGNLSGAKRKAVTSPPVAATELPSIGYKKKPKGEWSCELCQVSATSERGLTEHLQGKKHKAREAAHTAKIKGKNCAIDLISKKNDKSTNPSEMVSYQNMEQEEKFEGALLQSNQSMGLILAEKTNSDMKQNDDLSLQVVKDKKNRGSRQITQKNVDRKRKFKFWCEACQVGTCSETVMITHKAGKKHVMRLRELNKKGVPVLAADVNKAPQTQKEQEVVLDERERMADFIAGAADGEAVENPKFIDEAQKVLV